MLVNRFIGLCAAIALSCSAATARASVADELIEQARLAWEVGDREKAMTLATRAIHTNPMEIRGYLFRATLHQAGRQWDLAIADYDRTGQLDAERAEVYHRRGVVHFFAGHIQKSAEDFDKYVAMKPKEMPHHWQRGITLYYAGRYEDGQKQFESHQTVNPSDVENAAWHYLCVARRLGAEKARELLIPIKADRRIPLMKAHAMYAGKATPEEVLAEANKGEPDEEELKNRLFYGHLYIGLWHEANGRADEAKKHITLAGETYFEEHYMGEVARVHAALLKERK